ncbi:arylalkylamine N-acetyltransferase-like 2 [Lepeophtheirus salmonis]|nr:dopamine N-acetyltransferase-like [Lepeophtheirus salmonis]
MAKEAAEEMKELDWKTRVSFKLAESSKDEEKVVNFLYRHFVSHEPLNASINICDPGYRMPWFDTYVKKNVSEGLTVLAEDTQTKELVGIAIGTECKQSPEPSESSSSSEHEGCNMVIPRWEVMPVKFGLVLDFLEYIASSADIFETYNVSRYMELFILNTHSEKRYPGLGTEIVHRSMELGKKKGFELYVTEATSFFSQKIFTKEGFTLLKEMAFEEYRPHGKVVFNKFGMHDTIKLFVRPLK